jgi:replicative DNA helicase
MSDTRTSSDKLTFVVAPHSVEAEEALLGCLLIDPGLIAPITAIVEPGDFFIVKNQWVYEAVLDLWHAQKDVDYLTVANQLSEKDQLDEVGGDAYITQLLNNTPTSIYAETYAHLIQRAADRRRLLNLASELAVIAHDSAIDVKTAYTQFMQSAIEARPRSLENHLTLGASVLDRFLALQSRKEGEVTVFPLPFGSDDEGLPFMTGGKLFGIGGDEKTGKSALAETLAEHWAGLGLRGFYIHTEEKPDAKILRRYSRWSGIPFLRLEVGQLTEKEITNRAKAIDYTTPWESNLNLWYESLPTRKSILTLIHRAVQIFQAQFIVIDNFTDVMFEDIPRGSNAGVEAIRLLQEIDDLAVSYNVLIVLTTQMTTQESGKRIAFGTSGFNKKMTWFWDINRKVLDDDLVYRADGKLFRLEKGEFDPRVDIHIPASRYGRAALIPAFADLRRFYWRSRKEILIVNDVSDIVNNPNLPPSARPAPIDLGGTFS